MRSSLQLRHNGRDGVSNHQPCHCLHNRLFRRRSKKASKLRVTGLCAGNWLVTGEFPAQMVSNAENVSIWWRHHDLGTLRVWLTFGGASLHTICLLSCLSQSWWRYQMETFSALLAICAGNSPVPGEFPTQRPVTRSFDVLFDLRPNKQLSKQWWGWWFGTQSCPLWRHNNAVANESGGLSCITAREPCLRDVMSLTVFTFIEIKSPCVGNAARLTEYGRVYIRNHCNQKWLDKHRA